jgi:hypothetical protein
MSATNKAQLQHLDEAKRPNRIPVDGPRNILSIPDMDPAFHYTWQPDRPGQLERFLGAGYEFIKDPMAIGDPSVQKPARLNGMGTALCIKSGAETLYAMRQRNEWFEEDRRAYDAMVDGKEADAAKPIEDGGYGGVQSEGPQGTRQRNPLVGHKL